MNKILAIIICICLGFNSIGSRSYFYNRHALRGSSVKCSASGTAEIDEAFGAGFMVASTLNSPAYPTSMSQRILAGKAFSDKKEDILPVVSGTDVQLSFTGVNDDLVINFVERKEPDWHPEVQEFGEIVQIDVPTDLTVKELRRLIKKVESLTQDEVSPVINKMARDRFISAAIYIAKNADLSVIQNNELAGCVRTFVKSLYMIGKSFESDIEDIEVPKFEDIKLFEMPINNEKLLLEWMGLKHKNYMNQRIQRIGKIYANKKLRDRYISGLLGKVIQEAINQNTAALDIAIMERGAQKLLDELRTPITDQRMREVLKVDELKEKLKNYPEMREQVLTELLELIKNNMHLVLIHGLSITKNVSLPKTALYNKRMLCLPITIFLYRLLNEFNIKSYALVLPKYNSAYGKLEVGTIHIFILAKINNEQYCVIDGNGLCEDKTVYYELIKGEHISFLDNA
ncbi:MAG: hypothetical protein ABIB11_06455, partial [Candidatus Omnitrophota bacterium]